MSKNNKKFGQTVKVKKNEKVFFKFVSLLISYADLTSGNFRVKISCFKSLLLRRSELLRLLYRHHPETSHSLVVVTLTFTAITLDERSCTEVLQARSWSGKGLSTSTMTNSSVLQKKIVPLLDSVDVFLFQLTIRKV